MQNLFTFSLNQMQITISPRREIPSSNQTWQFENLQKWRFQLEKTTIHVGFSMKPYLITREQQIFGCVPYYFLLWRRCAVAMIYPDLVQTIILTEHWTVSKTWNIPRTIINGNSQLVEYDYPLKKGSMYQPWTHNFANISIMTLYILQGSKHFYESMSMWSCFPYNIGNY